MAGQVARWSGTKKMSRGNRAGGRLMAESVRPDLVGPGVYAMVGPDSETGVLADWVMDDAPSRAPGLHAIPSSVALAQPGVLEAALATGKRLYQFPAGISDLTWTPEEPVDL